MLVFGKVIDNSGNDSANKASDAVDNRLWTRWSSQGYPQWLELDLGSIRTIRSSELDPYLGRAYSYYIETKIGDRDQYLPLVDRRSNTIGGFAISDTFPPVQARYIRLTVTGSYEYTSDEVIETNIDRLIHGWIPPCLSVNEHSCVHCSDRISDLTRVTHEINAGGSSRFYMF